MASPKLFEPITLRGVEFSNRLWVSPMCQYAATNGVPNDWHFVHYGALSRGGAGLVIVEATGVTANGRISPGCLGLWNDEQLAAFQHITRLAHAEGAPIAIQLAHAGRKASTPGALPEAESGSIALSDGGWETVAPSAMAFSGLREPRELTRDEISQVVEAFLLAIDRAVEAEFDAVEIHAAHGYLLHEFLSPLSNLRDDEFGGSLANRSRVLREIVRTAREKYSKLPILVRISASEWRDDGFGIDEATTLAGMLADEGADLIDVSSGGNVAHAEIPVGPGYQTALAQSVKQGGLPVSAVGLIVSAQQAETVVATGQADVVQIARQALRNPFTPLAWANELRVPDVVELAPDQYHRAWRGQ